MEPVAYPFPGAPAAAGPSQIRDAEQSVEFLCRKFEALSEQLRLEESAREAAERRSVLLASEVESAEAAVSSRSNALAMELTANENSLHMLRASAGGAGQRAALQSERAKEEQIAGARLEQRCARISEDLRNEIARRDKALLQVAGLERELMHEQCEHGELGRRLRQVRTDVRVSMEDLRIAQQRSLLARNEHLSMDRNIEVLGRQHQVSGHECGVHERQLQEKHRQLCETESRCEALSEAVEAARSENVRREQRVVAVREDDRTSQSRLANLQHELAVSQRDIMAQSTELQREVEVAALMNQEMRAVERERASVSQEVLVQQRDTMEAEAAIENIRQSTSQANITREALTRRLEELNLDEDRHKATASGLRQTMHAEGLAFEDAQGELQAAFKRRETLAEDLALNRRARDALMHQLSKIQPEINQAHDRCRSLEEQLAQRARDVEEELVQQRHAQQEEAALAESLHKVQQQEAQIEEEIALGMNADSYTGGGWYSRTAERRTLGHWSGGGSSSRGASPAGLGRRGFGPALLTTPSPAPKLVG